MANLPCESFCPKCGSKDVNLLYREKYSGVPSTEYGKCGNRYATGQCHAFIVFRDHIDFTCRTCKHRWQTLPMTKKQVAALRGEGEK